MKRKSRNQRRRRWLLGSLFPGLLIGCTTSHPCRIDNCATIPPGAIPAPNGTYVNEFQARQAARAEADDFVIYKHEWYKGGRELGPYGEYHLGEIIKRLPGVPFPVLIEVVSGDPELNTARRTLIVGRLLSAGIADAEQRVILGFPQAGGLYGEEAERIFFDLISGQNLLNQSQFGFNRGGLSGFGDFNTGFGQGFGGPFGTFGFGLGGFGGTRGLR